MPCVFYYIICFVSADQLQDVSLKIRDADIFDNLTCIGMLMKSMHPISTSGASLWKKVLSENFSPN